MAVKLKLTINETMYHAELPDMKQPKQELLEYIDNGRLRYYSSKMEQIVIEIDNESARLIGQSKVSAAVFGGGRHTWSLQLTIQLINRNGLWLMTQMVASTY